MAKVVSTPCIKESNVLICDRVSRLTLNGDMNPVKQRKLFSVYSKGFCLLIWLDCLDSPVLVIR
jgi:hypothetical protein